MRGAEELTRPEGYVDKRDRRAILAVLVRSGGCPNCTQRIEGWGKVGCAHGETFPLCTKGRRPRFALDEKTIKGQGNGAG